MWRTCIVLSLHSFSVILATYELDINSLNAITTKTLTIWPNATVPFFVEPEHFDHEQTLSILTALSMFAFKTCLKFKPVMARPMSNEEVLVFINPDGTRRCNLETKGHSVFAPHRVVLGYECLKSPQIDMMIMRSLGFPFEHNRITRDMYIEVLQENIEPGAVELFTKEDTLPLDLRFVAYDINSVMHFGTRDYSKNGHRTILFKDPNAQQNRVGLSQTDLKKIELAYGTECRARDRQEKIELCQSYPGVARKKRETEDNILDNAEHSYTELVNLRRKRDVDPTVTKSLRVNPNITPPPDNKKDDITEILKELGVDHEVQEIVEQVYKVSALALKNAREKYCENNDTPITTEGDMKTNRNTSDILGIIEVIAEYTRDMVDDAVKNLTKFCEESETMSVYQRSGCGWNSRDPRCRDTYRSTKSGAVKYSTQHRPVFVQSTKHSRENRNHIYGRARNDTSDENQTTTLIVKTKREVPTTDKPDTENKQEYSEKFDSVIQKIGKKENKFVADKEGSKSEAHIDQKLKENEEKQEAATDNKTKVTRPEKSDGIDKKLDKEVKKDVKDADKESLRARTQLPGLSQLNRRSGKKHRIKITSENPIDQVYDSMDAETERPFKKIKGINKPEKIQFEEQSKSVKENVEGKHLKQLKGNDRAQKTNAKKKDLESNVEDDNIEIDEEIEPVEKQVKPKAKKREKFRQKQNDEEQAATIAIEDVDESPSQQKYGKAKRFKGPLPTTVKLSKKNEEFYKERRWPHGEVYYIIDDTQNYDLTSMRQNLAQVNSILKKKTCVTLNEITRGQANKYDDYIVIDNSPDYVTGRVGGKQKFGAIEMFQGGQHRQHTAMMVMAMLGFYFEVARHDRDKYIRVHMRHVRPDKLHHFEMIRSDATLPLPYDYASATHPAWQFWRQIGHSGISTVATYKEQDPDGSIMKSLGQNRKLFSDIDIVKINSIYGIDCFQRPRAKINKKNKPNIESKPTIK